MTLRFSPARGAGAISISSYLRGPQGAAATIAVGATTSLTPGLDPTVSNSGSSSAAVFDFGIPTSKTVAVGSTTTASAGASASVADSGDADGSTFDFTIPRGRDAGVKFSFESSTSMAAPAAGGVRLNDATLASVTAIAINAASADSGNPDVSDYIATWDDSTNTTKGYIEIRKEGSGSVLGYFEITSVTDNTAWLQLAVTYVSGAGSFSVGDPVYLAPDRIGNKGADGADGTIAGSTGATDNALLRADGTGGTTLQNSAVIVDDSGNVSGVATITTTGNIELGHATDTTISRSAAGVIAVEGVPLYSNIPQNSQNAAYTFVLTDGQKEIFHPAADTTARIWTIPANASVSYPVGTVIALTGEASSGVVTLSITSDTLVWTPSGSTGSRTLTAPFTAAIKKITTTKWHLIGNGIS